MFAVLTKRQQQRKNIYNIKKKPLMMIFGCHYTTFGRMVSHVLRLPYFCIQDRQSTKITRDCANKIGHIFACCLLYLLSSPIDIKIRCLVNGSIIIFET